MVNMESNMNVLLIKYFGQFILLNNKIIKNSKGKCKGKDKEHNDSQIIYEGEFFKSSISLLFDIKK